MGADMNEDEAALKIQAIQRGRAARKDAEAKRDAKEAAEKQAESDSAKKIQALQRGRLARREAQEKKAKATGAFVRPFVKETSEEAVLMVHKQAATDAFSSFEKLTAALDGEFPSRNLDLEQIYYSTKDTPDSFGNRLCAKLIARANDVLAMRLEVEALKTALREAEKATVDPCHAEGKPKSKTELANEEKALAKDVAQKKNAVNAASYKADVEGAKLVNYTKLHSIKVIFV
eukprot:TRINITY_DN2927_c0_g1_i2.p2 TRINITY_DN2927_c0_g1~~TRINITY_DN2927_c0_g1_i2.p2  ORF type:complete len:232 (+),score=109.53 TRINITY_DN2927_c0_g1_i2:48-743(+)